MLRVCMWAAAIICAVCVLANVVSLSGYDLTQLVPQWRMDGSQYQGLAFLPLGIAFVALLTPLAVARRDRPQNARGRSRSPVWTNIVGLLPVAYLIAIAVYMAIVFDFGGPDIHNGVEVIWLKGQSKYLPVSGSEYHHAVALVTLYISAWGMVCFANFAAAYRAWLEDATAARAARAASAT